VLAERYPAIESNLNSIVAFIAQFATIVDATDIPERVLLANSWTAISGSTFVPTAPAIAPTCP
jgi:hypothetical protein